MSPRKGSRREGPSASEVRLRGEVDKLRREVQQLRKASEPAEATPAAGTPGPDAPTAGGPPPEPSARGATPAGPKGTGTPLDLASLDREALERQVVDLATTRQRLSRLYFSQVEENRKRQQKLHEMLENISRITAILDLDAMLDTVAGTIRESLGFGAVLVRLREPDTDLLRARAFAGLGPAARAKLEAEDVRVEVFLSWLRDEFKVSRSYFISHTHVLSREMPKGYASDLGKREEWEWHSDDVLLIPLFNRQGDLQAYFSVDDPRDRLVPSRETIELLEIFGQHAVVAIENARLYRQLEQHSRELEEANQRMQEMHALKSNFLSAVSHELRTPLTAIRAYVDTLLGAGEGELDHAQTQRFLGIVNEEAQRLARLIESVLDLNRFDSGDLRMARQSVDLAEVLEETRRLLEPVALTGQVDLKVALDLADTRLDADRDQMRQLVLHLGSNAVKFTPPGGTVTLRLCGDERDITLDVEDTGIGIPKESLERVFERFYQVDSSLVRKYGGTGLGLAICKSIVEWHGGSIQVRSETDRGSCFSASLPRRSGPRVALRSTPRGHHASDEVLRLALEMVADVVGARVVSLLAPEADGALTIRAAIGLDERIVREARIRSGQGVAGWVAEHRRPVCVSGANDDGDVTASGRGQYTSGTFISVPLEGENGFIGVLNVTDPVNERPFDAEDCHLLLHLANRVAAAWDQALAMEARQEGVEDTTQALKQILQHLDRRRRMAPDRVRLARLTARELGLSESEVGVISFAASIHDVGMAGVGDEVVGAATSLSDDQRGAVEQHPEQGAEMLRPIESVGVVRDVVLSHHEWFDGSGYPRGLEGEAIPVGGRILAVVDAYESMTIGRAHRKALDGAEAVVELHRLSGRQFDPGVVEAFERALQSLAHESERDASHEETSVAAREGR